MGTHSDGKKVTVAGFNGPYWDRKRPMVKDLSPEAQSCRRIEANEKARKQAGRGD